MSSFSALNAYLHCQYVQFAYFQSVGSVPVAMLSLLAFFGLSVFTHYHCFKESPLVLALTQLG